MVIVGVLGTGVPGIVCLRPAEWPKWWPSTAHLHQLKLKTLARGQARNGLTRQAREEAERSRQGVPREVLAMQAMTIETRRAPASAVSLFPLWCKGGKRRHGVPRHQAKVTISVQRDQDQQSGRTEVTVDPKTASSLVPLAVEDH